MVAMNSCRACTSGRLHMFLALGDHPLANGFLTREQLDEPETLFSLDVHACLNCGLIQIADQIPAEFFRQYVYVPSASPRMQHHFDEFAAQIKSYLLPATDSVVVDIGCNDGLLLTSLQSRGVRTLGIDPATNIVERARAAGIEVVNEYFDPGVAAAVRERLGPAGVITTTNAYHHIGDLDSFTEGVRLLLAEDGVFVVELPHALNIVEQVQFDGVYHEHVSQFTVTSLDAHLRRFGFCLTDVTTSTVHGGSIRALARPARPGVTAGESVRSLIAQEHERALFQPETYDAFRVRVEDGGRTLLKMLAEIKDAGQTVAGYGASARGNTLLNHYGIGTDTLDYIADRNELKQGLYTPGMHIPVVAVDHLLADQPDYVLVLAWNFATEIMEQLAEYRGRGGRFLLPLPEPRLA